MTLLESDDPAARRSACILASRRPVSEKLRRQLRDRALDVDEKVAAAAMRAVREDLRAEGVATLVEQIVDEPPGERRWILLDCVIQAACGAKDRPPVRGGILPKLGKLVTPLEKHAADELLRKGADEFRRTVRDNLRRRLGR